MDRFVLLTPLILLPIVLLFVFVGCSLDESGLVTTVSFGTGGDVDVPVPGDYDGLGQAQPAFYRATDQSWHIWRNGDVFQGQGHEVYLWNFGGQADDIPVPGDYGIGHIEPAVFRPSDGTWHVYDPGTGKDRLTVALLGTNASSLPVQDHFSYGHPVITAPGYFSPVPGSFLENGLRRLALFHSGQFYVFDLQAGGNPIRNFTMGMTNDFLVPGNYGEGTNLIGVFNPATGQWQAFDPTGMVHHDFTLASVPTNPVPIPPALYSCAADATPRLVVFDESGTWTPFHVDSSTPSHAPLSPFGGVGSWPVPENYEKDGFRAAIFDSGHWSEVACTVQAGW